MGPDLTVDEKMTIDPNTGLPRLPDHLAWKVWRSGEDLYVFLVFRSERSPGFWKKLFGAPPIVKWNEFHTSEYLQKMAGNYEKALLDAATIIYKKIQRVARLDELVGIYPPKSIL